MGGRAQVPFDGLQGRDLQIPDFRNGLHDQPAPGKVGVVGGNCQPGQKAVGTASSPSLHGLCDRVFDPGARSRGSLGVAILSRRPLADLESIELPFFHVRFNAGRRVALAATIDLDGTPVRLYSVHLDNRLNPGQRIRQLAPVMDAAAAWDGPAVIAGDMNTSPFVWLGHVVPVPAGVQDDRLERYVRGRGFTTPVVGSGATHKWLSMRLDAIYTRGLGVVAHEVEHGVRHSDHLPLWADLTL